VSGEQNRCLPRPGANPKSICFSTDRHGESSWVQRPKATAAATPPARPLADACAHPRVSAPPLSGHAAVPSEVPSRSSWATDLVVAPRWRIRRGGDSVERACQAQWANAMALLWICSSAHSLPRGSASPSIRSTVAPLGGSEATQRPQN
jgi:hypothetical protein